RFDPLDKAVEKLWFSGIVVVAAAGNDAGQESGVLFAPGNDPFVITVGAEDISGSVSTNDDFPAPWSSYGYTRDGFATPELSAAAAGSDPPNPNRALDRFLIPDPDGGSLPVFDQATWTTNALADPNWDAATWMTATWTTATWTTATWTTATWTTAAWDAATWTT